MSGVGGSAIGPTSHPADTSVAMWFSTIDGVAREDGWLCEADCNRVDEQSNPTWKPLD